MNLDEALVANVRHALQNLYNPRALQSNPLAQQLQLATGLSPQSRMRLLRSTVMGIIEKMNPGPSVPLRAWQARSYSVLNLHYVECLEIKEVAQELNVSDRQLYRDLRRAEEDVAASLVPHLVLLSGDPPAENQGKGVGTGAADLALREADRLASECEQVSIRGLLVGARSATGLLAVKQSVEVCLEPTISGEATVYTNRQVARQVIVMSLSYALQNARPSTTVTLRATSYGESCQIWMTVSLGDTATELSPLPQAVPQLASRLGRFSCTVDSDKMTLFLSLGKQVHATVLVIDDNIGMSDLVQRYLIDEPYRVFHAQDATEGQRLIDEISPDIIVLDVMLPGQDGWEVLQHLRTQATTRRIPVVVCSVLEDPELAISLGAVAFVPKPVSRSKLVDALGSCLEQNQRASHPAVGADSEPPQPT